MDIICATQQDTISLFRCFGNTYNINHANNVYFECDEEYACESTVYNINNVTNRTLFSCVKGCIDMVIIINNAYNLDISCDYSTRYMLITLLNVKRAVGSI